ncbi:benzoate/H(+) symporter BenE family transporter [Falsirhodobacter sp. 1013]|uniref:benzoate/H(+) symporter BenE family transporter n=1 Tax=Falsirhodobacter sp. 1013 TaxID=3417566 RepID=UPI003EBA1481
MSDAAGPAGKSLAKDASLSAVLAGIISTLISYAGPLVIVFQAARGMPPALLESWVWAISIGSGVLGIALSLRYRVPVIIAWNAPGSALLVTLLPTVSFAEALGAYILASVAILLIAFSGVFDRLVRALPRGITAAMLAGILFSFTVEVFAVLPLRPGLVGAMSVAFFLGRRLFPRYAVVAVLVAGCAVTALSGDLAAPQAALSLTLPVFTAPEFSLQALIGISLPLVVVALTGQWMPGLTVLRESGYRRPDARPLIGWSATASMILAPFGCHGLNLAAITAAICTGPESHPDPGRRYIAGLSGGAIYLLLGSISATVLGVFAALPPELIVTLAGLALFPTIATALAGALGDPQERDAALTTFAVSASGMSLFGLGAGFWSLMFGLIVHIVLRWSRRARQ